MEAASLVQPNAQEQIAVAAGRAEALLGQAKALSILDGITREFAANLRSQITTYGKQLETMRLALVGPLNNHVKRINEGFRKPTGTLDAALAAVDAELRRDRAEQERLAAEARQKAEEEQRRLQAQAEAEARARAEAEAERARKEALAAGFGKKDAKELAELTKQEQLAKPVLAPAPQIVVPAPPAKTLRSETGARVTFTDTWDIEIADLDLVPVKYLRREVNRAAVLCDLRAGVKTIAGLRITPTQRPGGR